MADEKEPTGRGSGMSRKVGGAPIWLWAVGLGGVAGLVWLARRRSSAAAGSAADASAADPDGQTSTIVPQYGGLAEAQYANLLAAIQSLQGAPSQPLLPGSFQPAPVDARPIAAPPPGVHRRVVSGIPVASGETGVHRHPIVSGETAANRF